MPDEVFVETSVERLVESFLKTYFETTVFISQQQTDLFIIEVDSFDI